MAETDTGGQPTLAEQRYRVVNFKLR